MIDFTKPYIVKDKNAIQPDSIAFLIERTSLANGIYVGERIADKPERDIFNMLYESNVRDLGMTAEKFIDRVIEKRDAGKLPIVGLPKFTKTFANALGDEAPLFVNDNQSWLLTAWGVRTPFLTVMKEKYTQVALLNLLKLQAIAVLNKPMKMAVIGNIAVITTDSEILVCGTIDAEKRMSLLEGE